MDEQLGDDLVAAYRLACEQLAAMRQRAEVAETALAAEFVYAIDLVNRYGADMRKRGVKGLPSVEFTHWKAANE